MVCFSNTIPHQTTHHTPHTTSSCGQQLASDSDVRLAISVIIIHHQQHALLIFPFPFLTLHPSSPRASICTDRDRDAERSSHPAPHKDERVNEGAAPPHPSASCQQQAPVVHMGFPVSSPAVYGWVTLTLTQLDRTPYINDSACVRACDVR